MRLGIVADTHDNLAAVDRIVETFEREGIETVIHCGDFIAPPVVGHFDGLELHGVLGNNDGELDGLEAAFRQLGGGSRLHGRFADLHFPGARIAVLHGEDRDEVEGFAASGEYDYVCYGHHHRRDRREIDGTTILNPGAQFPSVPDEHRTVVVLDTETDELRFVEV